MKKKIKDLTLLEALRFCENCGECPNCPLVFDTETGDCYMNDINKVDSDFLEDDEREVEIK